MIITPELLNILTNVATIVVPIGAIIGFGLRRIDKKFDKIDERFIEVDNKFVQQSVRTDKLYEMFIDLVKETRRV